MASKPNKVGQFYTYMKGDRALIFLYGGDVVEDGNMISGITLRRDTAKGPAIATGITLELSGGEYIIPAGKLTELHKKMVKVDKIIENGEFDEFIKDLYHLLKSKTAENFIKK